QVGHQKEFGLVGNYISSSSVGSNNYEGTYYVHSDHVGSAAWITNQNGTAVQHLQYMAWGELFADQRSTDYSERYTFSGKERDAETGFSYFIARYYLSEYGIFGGVDQLSDKYSSISPYAYCANNPVMLVDPDGRENVIAINKKENPGVYKASQNFPQNKSVIHIWAHGNEQGIELASNISIKRDNGSTDDYAGVGGLLKNNIDIKTFLETYSDVYVDNNLKSDALSVIVLHSCSTGKKVDGMAPIGQQISELQNVLVVAPSENIQVTSDGVYLGPGVIGVDANGHEFQKESRGWNVFYKGQKVDSFQGKTLPIFINTQNLKQKYEKIYNEKYGE
ncbi:MAG: RHS repeat-associated core domain-containing protein, partial [bacterium]